MSEQEIPGDDPDLRTGDFLAVYEFRVARMFATR